MPSQMKPSTHMQASGERISRGDVILLDGATGIELERRDVPMSRAAWSAAALVTHPETIRQLHEDYIHAGAVTVPTNRPPRIRRSGP